MEKKNHLLAWYDSAGNFTPIGSPVSYDEGAAKLSDLMEKGSEGGGKAALIALRSGIRKRRPIPAKNASQQPKKGKGE